MSPKWRSLLFCILRKISLVHSLDLSKATLLKMFQNPTLHDSLALNNKRITTRTDVTINLTTHCFSERMTGVTAIAVFHLSSLNREQNPQKMKKTSSSNEMKLLPSSPITCSRAPNQDEISFGFRFASTGRVVT